MPPGVGWGIGVTFTHANVPATPSPELMLCLYRVTQEALHNCEKHSQAAHVSVRVAQATTGLLVERNHIARVVVTEAGAAEADRPR